MASLPLKTLTKIQLNVDCVNIMSDAPMEIQCTKLVVFSVVDAKGTIFHQCMINISS